MGIRNKGLYQAIQQYLKENGTHLFGFWAVIVTLTIALRFVEYSLITSGHVIPDEATGSLVPALWWDLVYSSIITLFAWAVFIIFGFIHRLAGVIAAYLFVTLYLLIASGLLAYFSHTLLPLEADFFAYSFSEIATTIETSVSLRPIHFLLIALLPGLPLIGLLAFRMIPVNPITMMSIVGWVLVSSLIYLFAYPTPDRFDHHLKYNLTVNKTALFFQEAFQYGMDRVRSDDEFTGEEYPLLRPNDDEDVLGPFFETGDRPPNFVIIKIEGLGGSFMDPHAPFGGFTPYLDSLASESLYWTHFLSSSGRSFNVHPSLLGSLPYGRSGFMDLGFDMPAHSSIIQMLNKNEYYTSHFSGYDSSFDNLDIFLEYQGIDKNFDKWRFPDELDLLEEDDTGFAWGYADHEMFEQAHEELRQSAPDTPRLDLYFTLNLHEPFIIPDQQQYLNQVDDKLQQLNLTENRRRTIQNYPEIFAALLYTDDAIRRVMEKYQNRPDYEDTIFIITGDHRIGPIGHESVIDRFYVPFMIYSPMLTQSKEIESLGAHLQLPATLTAFLRENYDVATPDSVHWKTEPVSTEKEFDSELDIPLMRNKNQMIDYIRGTKMLAGNQAFRINRGMELDVIGDSEVVNDLSESLRDYRTLNNYIIQNDKLMRPDPDQLRQREEIEEEELLIDEYDLEEKGIDELFFYARDLAFDGEYEDARVFLRRVLRFAPNYHDARVLIGRTLGWEGRHEESLEILQEVIRRNPTYADAYVAKSDVTFWQGNSEETLKIVDEAFNHLDEQPELLFRKARALHQLDRTDEAIPLLEKVLDQHHDHEDAATLYDRLRS